MINLDKALVRLLGEFVRWAKVYKVWDKVSNSAAVQLHELILQAENRLAAIEEKSPYQPTWTANSDINAGHQTPKAPRLDELDESDR